MVSKDHTEHRRETEAAYPISPKVSGYHSRYNDRPDWEKEEVPRMLKLEEFVLLQVGGVCRAGMQVGDENHPSKVVPPESTVSIVRVFVGVGVSMVGTVGTRPKEG